MGIELSDYEKQLDIVAKLKETEDAIDYLAKNGIAIPPEAIELRAIMRRLVAAEETMIAIEKMLKEDLAKEAMKMAIAEERIYNGNSE